MSKPDPVDALHAALLVSDLKISGAAKAIARSPAVMYNKFCETSDAEPTARECLALADAIQTDAYAVAVAGYFGGVFYRVPEGVAADDDVLQAHLTVIERMGEFSADLIKAREDGVIEPHEFQRQRNDAFATMAALQTMIAELETLVREFPTPVQIRGSGRR